MKKTSKIILILSAILIVILSISITSFFFFFSKLDYMKEFNMSMVVGDHIGIGIIKGELSFGMVPPGQGSATRHIDVFNSRNYPLRVFVRKYGDIKDWIKASPSRFTIGVNENKKVDFEATPPPNTYYGNYTGIVRFYFFRIQ